MKVKIIGEQGQGSGRYLLDYGGGNARVADMGVGTLFPINTIQSILKAGYWEDYEHDEKLLQSLLTLPEMET